MPNQPISIDQQIAMNAAARQNLIRTGLYMTKRLQPVTGAALGSSQRINLERIGITTGVLLEFAVPVAIAATVGTPSPFGPYNLAQMVKYTDYAGIQRVLTNGYQLHALNCFRGMRLADNAQKMAGYLSASETGIDTNILKLPTAIANDTIYFSLFVPMAYDARSDLRGAVLSQTIYGDHYITVDLANSLVNADSFVAPYTAGGVSLGAAGITITAYQQYIMPQQGVANLPMADLSIIYAIEGNFTDNSNITAGQSKYLNWPNNRAVMSAFHVFDNGNAGTLNGADLNGIVLLGNSNTNIREMSPSYVRRSMRYHLGTDLASGAYYLSSRNQPITTQLYGNVQTRFDVATASAGAYFVSQYESTYPSGTPLPGIVQ